MMFRSPFSTALRPLHTALALLALGVLAPSAHAGEEDDDRRNGRGIDSRSVDPEAARTAEYRKAAREKRLAAINRAKGLLSSPNLQDSQKPVLMLRLADYYFKQGRDIFFGEMERFDAQYDQCFNTDGCNTDNLQPDNRTSQQWQERSIKLYKNLLRSYPRYERADQATYFLGSAQTDIGKRKEGVASMKTLVKRYPDSEFKTDALITIGEYYFDNNEAFPALKAYLMASGDEQHPRHGYALYKLGWCYYNVGEYDDAIGSMKRVVNKSMSAEQTKSNIQLQDESLKDLVRFFADASQMNEAYDYFKSLGKNDLILKTLRRLASQYYENGQFEQSIETYKKLILEDPNNIKNPDYQGEIVKAYGQLGDKPRTLEAIDRMLRDYGPNSPWARANASNPNAVKEATDSVELTLRKVAADYHTEGQKLEKARHPSAKETYEQARSAYAAYLNNFSGHKNAYDVHYAYGELLFELEDFSGAYEQYMAVVKLDPNGQYSKFCAESAVFAAKNQVKVESGAKSTAIRVNASDSANRDPIPLTDWENRLVSACKQFADLYPNDKKVIEIIYESGYLLYSKFQFDKAAEQFNSVINMNPRSSQAERAANLILETYAIKKDSAGLKKNAKFYLDMDGLGSTKFKKETAEVYEKASFQLILDDLEKDKDKVKAANGYMAFYEEFPNSKVAANALNNASVYYYDSNRVADAVRVRRILVDDPKFGKKTPFYYDQVSALGYDYQQMADYEQASTYYERLFSLYDGEVEKRKKAGGDDKDARVAEATKKANGALFAAAVYRNALGDKSKAIENYNAWMAAFPGDEGVADAQLRVARIYDDQDSPEAANIYSKFYAKPPTGATQNQIYYARLRHGQALVKAGKTRDWKRLYATVIKQWAKDGKPAEATEIVAEMMFKLAEPKFEEFLAIDLTGQGKTLGRNLKNKQQKYVGIEREFSEIVATGAGEWGVASLVTMAKAYEDMAESWRESEVPNEFDEDQAEMYSMRLEDQAYVQDEKAANFYKSALEAGFKLTLYNDDTAFATRRLGELRPKEYPALSETLLKPTYTSKAKGREFAYENEMK